MSSDSYTFQDHIQRVALKRSAECVMSPHHVQVRKQGIVYCASIIDYVTMSSGIELWKVNCTSPESFIGYVVPKNVRACGDGNCSCFPAFVDPAFSQAGVVAPPDSLNIETLG